MMSSKINLKRLIKDNGVSAKWIFRLVGGLVQPDAPEMSGQHKRRKPETASQNLGYILEEFNRRLCCSFNWIQSLHLGFSYRTK
jgi:hypothetical protein